MRLQKMAPTGVERTFRDDQIIVSKTDLKGRLTYVNSLFVEISGYTEPELLGQPHNVIRHPDMPRSVFALLWERIRSGEEIFCYVQNLSADGAHYWVLAHVTPTFDTAGRIIGYHSNRRTVSRRSIEHIQELYGRIAAEEARHTTPQEAVNAGRRVLEEALASAGQTYDEYVWTLIRRALAA